jgi:CTP synthase (UTP-ammonia lyase)
MIVSMSETIKIAIVGDFNFTYNSHHATNLALEHAERLLEVDLSYYWIRIQEIINMKSSNLQEFDGFWIAPGPYSNEFFLSGAMNNLLAEEIPLFITGDAYKHFVELLIKHYNLNPNGEKLISDNLVSGNQFEPVQISPKTTETSKIYATHSNIELTSSRFSIYPQLMEAMAHSIIIPEAVDQFDEPEIIRLKNHPYALATMFCPQISSTREMPHPLISTFIRSCQQTIRREKQVI